MSEELKACPFCGGSAELFVRPIPGNDTFARVLCSECFAASDHFEGPAVDPSSLAIAAWNRRAEPQEATEEEILNSCSKVVKHFWVGGSKHRTHHDVVNDVKEQLSRLGLRIVKGAP